MNKRLHRWLARTASVIRRRIRGHWNDGATAVEMAMALPILVLFFVGTIQFGLLFSLKGNMDDVARDAVRRLALGTLSEAQSVTQVQNSLSNWGATFNVTATLPDPGEFAAVVEISVPIADVAFIDHLDLFTSGNLRTRIAMSTEQ